MASSKRAQYHVTVMLRTEKNEREEEAEEREEVSETLHGRKNLFRGMGILSLRMRSGSGEKERGVSGCRRWSDCGCDTCGSGSGSGTFRDREERIGFIWSSRDHLLQKGEMRLTLRKIGSPGLRKKPETGKLFVSTERSYRMIERSVVEPFRLNSFHLVAHSMGCIIALALAAKYPTCVESITLVAPPYFPSDEAKASYNTLNKLAERKIWPPLLFGSSVMSWYEHVGRTVCFVYCRNHLIWEWILKTITRKGNNSIDLTRHLLAIHAFVNSIYLILLQGPELCDKGHT
uniref:AB hydrolase-1 domain-containing protein n=1 Tax=Ananas comosus var. bracteatus TaxID=296719 RepID=A0A6V7PQJ0_ANACO|nr:unnamed protein product [Ananas comosus var. bracteatus]